VAGGRLIVTPPAYIGSEPVELAWQTGTFSVPSGSHVKVLLETASALDSVAARTDRGELLKPDWQGPGRREFGLALPVVRDTVLSVDVVDERGVRSAQPFRVRLHAVPDQPPDVRLAVHGVGELVTPVARLPFAVDVTDDYGLGDIHVIARAGGEGGRATRIDVADGKGSRSLRREVTVGVPYLGAAAGDRLFFRAVAADSAVAGGSHTGQSAELAFRVVSAAELLNALLLTQLDLRRDLEQQARLQRSLLDELAQGGGMPAMLATRERDLSPVLARIGEGYADVLDQMVNSGLLAAGAYGLRTAAIPGVLADLSGPAGAVERAAEALVSSAAGAPRAEEAMEEALGAMERVRAAMLLLEGYSSIVASVREVSAEQQDLLHRTVEREESLLQGVFGP
jgi:hypothetical protein